MKNSFKTALINSLGTAAYVALVAAIMTRGEQVFGSATGVLGGAAILLLMVLSALVVGSLVLAKPLMLYLDGSKKEAVKLLLQTIIILAVITAIFLSLLAIISK